MDRPNMVIRGSREFGNTLHQTILDLYSSRLGADHIILAQFIKNCGTHLTVYLEVIAIASVSAGRNRLLNSPQNDYRKNLEIDTKRHH